MFGHTDNNQQQGMGAPVVSADNTQDGGGSTDTNSYGMSEIPASSENNNNESTSQDSFYTPPVPQDNNQQNDTTTQSSTSNNDEVDLVEIKQQALTALSPLVGHLEQDPIEKFKTTMMMIQAADDKS